MRGVGIAIMEAIALLFALSLPCWPPIFFLMYLYATGRRQFSLFTVVLLVTIEALALAVFVPALRRFQEMP